jgi:predicted ATPase
MWRFQLPWYFVKRLNTSININKLKLFEMENSAKKSSISSRMVLSAAAILAIQAMPSSSIAQVSGKEKTVQQASKSGSSIYIKIRDTESKNTIVGFENGNPVFKNSKGEFFTVNGKTGDLMYIKPDEFARFYCCMKLPPYSGRSVAPSSDGLSSGKRLTHIKIEFPVDNLNLVGVDKQGNTIQKNSRGETFYLDPVTGDMIFVKI